MKKNVIYILILLFIFLLPNKCLAYEVNKISDIKKPPVINNKKTIYIPNMNSQTCKLTNNNIGKKIKQNNGSIYLDISNDTYNANNIINYTGSPLLTIKCSEAGYYIDDNGDKKMVDVIISIEKLEIYSKNGKKANDQYYKILKITKSGFSTVSGIYDKNFESTDIHNAIQQTIKFKIVNHDSNTLAIANDMKVPWNMTDIDIRDKTCDETGEVLQVIDGKTQKVPVAGFSQKCKYRESIAFFDGFYSRFFVQTDTFLETSNYSRNGMNGIKFTATNTTNNAPNYPNDIMPVTRSGVVGYQTKSEATIEWTGSGGAGTAYKLITSSASYPAFVAPNLNINSNATVATVKVGKKINYVVKQTFPYVISENAAAGISLTITLDSALEWDNNGKTCGSYTVKSDKLIIGSGWNCIYDVNSKKITLTAKKPNKVSYYSNETYTFTFKNIKVTSPDNKHAIIRESFINLNN